MNEVKVSAIMPVYNGEKYLRKALESLSDQTLKEIEIICVDDGSSDNSENILREYAKNESRMIVLRNEKNTEGAGEARNIGIREAKGDFLAFVDSDDFFSPEMLERSYEKAVNLDVDVLMFDSWYYDDEEHVVYESASPLNGIFMPNKEKFAPSENINGIFRMTHGASWARLFRRSFVLDKEILFFDSNFWEDACFVYTALCEAGSIGVLREKLMYYRYNHSSSQTSRKGQYALSGIKSMVELKRRFDQRGLTEIYRVPLINDLLTRAFLMFDLISDVNTFESVFEYMKNDGIEKLGAYELDKIEFYNVDYLRWRDALKQASTPFEYLITRNVETDTTKMPIFNIELGRYTKGPGRIVIYGAGVNGKKAFVRLIGSEQYKLCAWVDKQFSVMGYPVQSPEILKKIDFEYVLIAIESGRIAEEVREYLRSLKVEDEKIIWIPCIVQCVSF